ncbi:unnamed protein product [Mytilus edulis]|uniref:OTU domain-containing protein n=1 Tax=Mytilus edulis TaxID=6550 RepID=A0A8S3SXR9_MYTED|nr:unnamed protein product [Mytilus edulis]
MDPADILDEKTEECENILEGSKKRSQINEADEKKWNNDHPMHHDNTKQYDNALSLDNEGSMSNQNSLDMVNCTGSPPWEDLQGKLCENGSSIVIELTDICHLYHILKEFVKDDPQSLFEITSVNVTISAKDKDTSNTKKTYNDDKTNVVKDKDLEILGSYVCTNLNYIPVGYITKQKLCSKFKISHKNVKETADISITFNMETRISYTNKKKDSRSHIAYFKDLSSFVRDPYENAEEYVRMRKMKESNTWGTELEILAAAHFMQVDIYTFTNNKWIKYSAHQIDNNINVENEAIYLKHVEESSHYEVVMSVEGNREYDLLEKSKNTKSINVDFDKFQSNICIDHDLKKSTRKTLPNEIIDHTDITDVTKKRSRERTNINGNQVMEDRDLEILHPDVNSSLNYIPLGYKTKRQLCFKLKISHNNIKETSDVNEKFNLGKPVNSKSIISDGNSLFRALSFAISQRQEYHIQIRKKIVDHILHISKDIAPFVPDPYENAEEYVRMQKMKEPKTMGTELEILAAAHFMQADIYTFTNNKWIKYSAHQIDKDINVENEAIYLQHVEKSSHYEVVMNVEGNRVHNCTDTKNNNTLLNETQVDLTDIRRKRRRELEKMRYCQNDTVRDKKKRSCKETYWNNAIYRSLKIYKGSMKYINDETYRQDLIEKGK